MNDKPKDQKNQTVESEKEKWIRERTKLIIERAEKIATEEWENNQPVEFKGTTIIKREMNAIKELEIEIGEIIPIVSEIEWNIFGVIIANNHVVGLGLYKKGLTLLPRSIEHLTELTELYLVDNQLTTLPDSIDQLKALTKLSLINNKFTTIPDFIGRLTALVRLDLDNNQLTTLPDSIGQLKSLKILNLYNNQLTAIPESIGQLTELTKLSVSNNQLTAIPEIIGKLTALT